MRGRCAALALLLTAASASAEEGPRFKFSAEAALEARHFWEDAAFAGQGDGGFSLSLKPELYYEWAGANTSLTFTPFARWDQGDDERTHADLRELFIRHRKGALEWRAGVRTVFWGVTESAHLVNIINQTDLVENPDGEDKLGQPMLSLIWTADFGNLELFALPYFRERQLPGPEGRLRGPLPYDQGEAIYESSAREKHFDGALRWSLSRGGMDLGLSYFKGTARAPRFTPRLTASGPVLTPVYDQIEQSGLDLNYLMDGWLLKLEAIYQDSRAGHYAAAAGGFEYTFGGAFGSAADVGWLMEYLWDERDDAAPTPFQRDLFAGTRIAFNDEASSEILAGLVADTSHHGLFGNIEASRRIGEANKLVLEVRIFADVTAGDPLTNLAEDDYVSLEFIRFF